MGMWRTIGGILTIGGGAFCWLNFYLSFIRYPLHRLRGQPRETFRWTSGIPLIGSLCVVAGLVLMKVSGALPSTALLALALASVALDTGGIHWFIGTMVWWWLKERRQSRPNG
jgi:hypothetical protein